MAEARCTITQPVGWRCTRGYHVDGPCACVPLEHVHEFHVEVIRRRSWRHPFRRSLRIPFCACGVAALGVVR